MFYVNESKVILKRKKVKTSPKITSSLIASDLLRELWDEDIDYKERFKVLLLDRSNKVISIEEVSSGGVSGTVVDPKIIFKAALEVGASGLILVHNHPSGNVNPSKSDDRITKKLVEGGKLLDITVLDHLVITSEEYYSYGDEGLI